MTQPELDVGPRGHRAIDEEYLIAQSLDGRRGADELRRPLGGARRR